MVIAMKIETSSSFFFWTDSILFMSHTSITHTVYHTLHKYGRLCVAICPSVLDLPSVLDFSAVELTMTRYKSLLCY